MLPPDRGRQMLEYRAYLIGRNGNIVDRIDMFCCDDKAAKVCAQHLVDTQAEELWQFDRLGRAIPHWALGHRADFPCPPVHAGGPGMFGGLTSLLGEGQRPSCGGLSL
jgi:hypothetical protein